MFELRDLRVRVEGKEILKGVNLRIMDGEVHALMGPNGSGKSTLALVVMGHPKYEVVDGDILFNGESILELSPDERAKRGIFLCFQYPMEIEGVSLSHFLWTSVLERRKLEKTDFPDNPIKFRKEIEKNLNLLKLPKEFMDRYVNVGFSGGEKKRTEIVQLLTLKAKFALLDEVDSGLDIDSVKIVANAINALRGPGFSSLVITHYQRILNYLIPDVVHVIIDGKIVITGGQEIIHALEERGYEWLMSSVKS